VPVLITASAYPDSGPSLARGIARNVRAGDD
jgi:hypothetical protein